LESADPKAFKLGIAVAVAGVGIILALVVGIIIIFGSTAAN
jgi:hypothetical protein